MTDGRAAKTTIHRRVDPPFHPTEEVEVPVGALVCESCEGKGLVSKYDEGWSSIVHDPQLAALHACYGCGGLGYRWNHA